MGGEQENLENDVFSISVLSACLLSLYGLF